MAGRALPAANFLCDPGLPPRSSRATAWAAVCNLQSCLASPLGLTSSSSWAGEGWQSHFTVRETNPKRLNELLRLLSWVVTANTERHRGLAGQGALHGTAWDQLVSNSPS